MNPSEMTDSEKPQETPASRIRNTLEVYLDAALAAKPRPRQSTESVAQASEEPPLASLISIDTQEESAADVNDKDNVASNNEDGAKLDPKTEPGTPPVCKVDGTATQPGAQSQKPQKPSSTNAPIYLLLGQEIGPATYYQLKPVRSTSLSNEMRPISQIYCQAGANLTPVREQAPSSLNHWGAGAQGTSMGGVQANTMYQHPSTFQVPQVYPNMQGQVQGYPWLAGPQQQSVYPMNSQTPQFQGHGSQLRYQSHQNQSRLPIYQPFNGMQNFFGNVPPRPTTQQPLYFNPLQAPPMNSSCQARGVPGGNPQTEDLLARSQATAAVQATATVQAGNLQQLAQKPKPMPLISLQIERSDVSKVQNGSAENDVKTGAIRKRQKRIKGLMEIENSKTGKSTSKQIHDHDISTLRSISGNQASLELKHWSQEMIAQFAACITKVSADDSESDSLVSEKEQPLADCGAKEKQKNKDHDGPDATEKVCDNEFNSVTLGQKSEKNTEISPIPGPSKEQLSVTPANEVGNETEESDGTHTTAMGCPPLKYVYRDDQWSPLNKLGKKVYDRDFLIKLRSDPNSNIKPLNLPNIDFVLEENSNASRSDFNHLGTPRGRSRLLEPNDAGKTDEVVAALSKIVQGVWNKSVPQKFDTFADQVKLLKIDTQEKLQGVVELVFEKAIDDPNSAKKYAFMCRTLAKMRASGVKKGQSNDQFGKLIAAHCQMEFDKSVKDIEACADPESQEVQAVLTKEEIKNRTKCFNNIRFMGELYKRKMLDTDTVHKCIDHLLKNIDDQSLEYLWHLLSRVGKKMEHQNQDLDPYFKQIEDIVEHDFPERVSSRICFMLQDLIEFRANKWKARTVHSHTDKMDQSDTDAETESLGGSCCTTEVDDLSQLIRNLPQCNRTDRKRKNMKSELLVEANDGSSGVVNGVPSMKQIQKHLLHLMATENENLFEIICSWISLNVDKRTSEPEFIKVLMTAILESSIETYNHVWQFRADKFRNLQILIPWYIDADINLLELQCLIAIQEYIHQLESPQRTLFKIVEKQIIESILSFDVFLACEGNQDLTTLNKKSVALMALKAFFTFLKESNDESGLEEMSGDVSI